MARPSSSELAPCAYPRHRQFDWRHPRGSPWRQSERWTCGICYPPPFPLEYECAIEIGERPRRFALEWRGGSPPPSHSA